MPEGGIRCKHRWWWQCPNCQGELAALQAIVDRVCSLTVATAAARSARRHLPMHTNMPPDDGVPENAARIQAVLRKAAEAAELHPKSLARLLRRYAIGRT